jgi:competence protein ComEC
MDGLVNFSGLLLRKLWSLVSVTLLAQAGTLPFVLYYFKSIALYSVFTNILAVPLAFLVIITGLLLLIMPPSIFIGDILAWLVTIETKLLYSIAGWISSI